jgi:hypothetical protein
MITGVETYLRMLIYGWKRMHIFEQEILLPICTSVSIYRSLLPILRVVILIIHININDRDDQENGDSNRRLNIDHKMSGSPMRSFFKTSKGHRTLQCATFSFRLYFKSYVYHSKLYTLDELMNAMKADILSIDKVLLRSVYLSFQTNLFLSWLVYMYVRLSTNSILFWE